MSMDKMTGMKLMAGVSPGFMNSLRGNILPQTVAPPVNMYTQPHENMSMSLEAAMPGDMTNPLQNLLSIFALAYKTAVKKSLLQKGAANQTAEQDRQAAAANVGEKGKDATNDRTGGDAKFGIEGTHCKEAEEVAREMTQYSWQYYYDDKKSDAQTEASRSGNCCDLAQVAIKKFKERGIEAKLILGDIKGKSYTGGHYWVEYKDPATGRMTFFDPTATATGSKTADRAFNGLSSTYSKRK